VGHVDEALDVLALRVARQAGQEKHERTVEVPFPLLTVALGHLVLMFAFVVVDAPVQSHFAAVGQLENFPPIAHVRQHPAECVCQYGLQAGLVAPEGGPVLLFEDGQ